MATYFIFISSFIMKKKSRGKHLFESKKFRKLKSTDRNNQTERFSKDELIFFFFMKLLICKDFQCHLENSSIPYGLSGQTGTKQNEKEEGEESTNFPAR